MSEPAKVSGLASREAQKDGTEDPSTIQNKFMVGYQGWFTCHGDGDPIDPGHHGWLHWVDKPLKDGGRVTFEMWPDTTEYEKDELYELPGLSIPAGQGTEPSVPRPAKVFSSRNPKTVDRHYRWMRDHGISGAFLQRFLGEVGNGDNGMRRYRDEVVNRVKESANDNGRVWAIMYDISGVPSAEIEDKVKGDYLHLLNDLHAFDDPMYLHEKGRPVIAIWGMGMAHERHDASSLIRLLEWIKDTTPQGVYIFAGSPSHWRTRNGDCDSSPDFDRVWQNVDCMSPWYVGRFGTVEDAATFKQRMAEDIKYLQVQDEELGLHRDYSPVVFPGFSWQNLHDGPRNEIPREGGTFLYRQLQNALSVGAKVIYGAMFDEYDEATVLMPVVSQTKDTPSEVPFLALDEDDMELPSDWYLRICGLAAQSLKTGAVLPASFPMKALLAGSISAPTIEEQFAAVNLDSTKTARNKVDNDAIIGVLQSLQPPVRLGSLDRLSSDYTSVIDQYKYETTRNLLLLRELLLSRPSQTDLGSELTFDLWLTLLRLSGPGELQSIEGTKLSLDCLNAMESPPDLAHRILLHGIKPAFAANPHPQVDNNTGRKLGVAAGGERAKHEMFEDQKWKDSSCWGMANVLHGCLIRMSPTEITEDMALVLPPLLTLMDDYETFYRNQGLKCLDVVLEKVDARTLKRMGIDNLFLKSVQHSISLHPTPPNPPVLVHGLKTLFRLLPLMRDPASEDYANEVALAVDRGIKDGWQYAPSGMDGIEMMIEIGMAVELVCGEIGLGIVRWLNDLIPGLLSSSYLPPSPYAVGLQLTNLHALHVLLDTIKSTDRSERWRGQILDALARNWVGIEEDLVLRGLTAGSAADAEYHAAVPEMQTIQVLLRTVLEDLVQRNPDMRENEVPALLQLSPSFAGLCEGFLNQPPVATSGPPRLPARRSEATDALPRQPPPMPPRNQDARVEVASAAQTSQAGPALPARPDAVNAEESRFVPPLPTGGMLKTAPLPPRRTVEAVELPEVEQDNSRIGQARQHVNQIYDQYSPTIDAKKRDAQRAAQNMGGMAGRLMGGNQQNKDGSTQGNVGLKDLERMGQKALWNLGKAGTRVAGGIDRLQQQGRAQNAKPT